MQSAFWGSRRVLITGNTGFKGAWLTQWLCALGARVRGLSLPPPTDPSLFEQARLAEVVDTAEVDVRDQAAVQRVLGEFQPDVLFHLAAQPLVQGSYICPVTTYTTNVIGTVNVMEAIRHTPSLQAVVLISSDKCYENKEWNWGYREIDQLGGSDPYSNSKACAELAFLAYQKSFFSALKVRVASARAGNVIGGGDWAEFRLVPDAIRSFTRGEPLTIRAPNSVRPWQHVLEPLSGYLRLAELLAEGQVEGGLSFNFGPAELEEAPVHRVVDHITERWGGGASWQLAEKPEMREAGLLRLDSSRARKVLGWSAQLSTGEALDWATDWYKRAGGGADAAELCAQEIVRYEKRLRTSGALT